MDIRFLVRRAQAGDGHASALVMAELAPTMRAIVSCYYLPKGERADLMQEARLGAWSAIRDWESGRGASFMTFARQCIHRKVITGVKTATRVKHTPLNGSVPDENVPARASAGSDPADLLTRRGRLLDAAAAAHKLPLSSLESEVLRLFDDGQPYVEIAARLGTHEKSIDNALQRARRKLAPVVERLSAA